MKESLPRIAVARIAYLVVFAAFTGISLYQLINGTGQRFTWFFVAVGAFLFATTAYRLMRDLKKP